MNSIDLKTFQSATSLARTGYKTEAYSIFTKLACSYPSNINLLLWLAFTAGDLKLSRAYIEKANFLEPDNSGVARAFTWLTEEEIRLRNRDSLNVPPPPFNGNIADQEIPSLNEMYKGNNKIGPIPPSSDPNIENKNFQSNSVKTNSITRSRTPEEEELESKRAELATLEAELVQRELELATLKAELNIFGDTYMVRIGNLYAELDEVEALIAEAEAKLKPLDLEAREKAAQARAQAEESRRAAREAQENPEPQKAFQPIESLKKLYRQLAKLFHPDLATSDKERERRTKIMSEINAAYAAQDERRMREILQNWERSPESVEGTGLGAELIRILRKIAQVRERLEKLITEINELRNSELFELKMEVEAAQKHGQDLLAEMNTELKAKIELARIRLNNLMKGIKL